MGLIERVMNVMFGGGGNMIRETAEVFLPNAEASAQREYDLSSAAMDEFQAEFSFRDKSRFDKFMDGVNRVPRPALALGTLALFIMAMVDPIWFSARMQGLALVPEPLWWLLGIIVAFYFGARHQVKSIQFQKAMAATIARTAEVARNVEMLETLRRPDDPRPPQVADNPALADWRSGRDG